MQITVYRRPLKFRILTRLISFIFSLKIGKVLWLYTKCQIINVWRRLDQVITKNFFAQTILGKIFGTKLRNALKLDWTSKVWFLHLHVFWLLLPKLNVSKGDWALDYVSSQIWHFLKISLFPNILSFNSFGNLWGNSHTKFALLVITFRFTRG